MPRHAADPPRKPRDRRRQSTAAIRSSTSRIALTLGFHSAAADAAIARPTPRQNAVGFGMFVRKSSTYIMPAPHYCVRLAMLRPAENHVVGLHGVKSAAINACKNRR
jgi:hypothetical protein